MSILITGGRITTARRYSQTGLRRQSVSLKGRRRALDLYDTKDILFTHEQMKKAKRSNGSTAGLHSFGTNMMLAINNW
ncbi:unnamed protein product [Rotaria sordida]|uniref:Uncharacterized protein n=2 Tax=Rotaria sordida TaxID=392033 RepID=A0A818XGS5_9BILA|nr:unnamed protein product [Rotaria sordida]